MPLPPDYLTYPHRKHGMDNPHYGWEPADRRAALRLASGAKCLVTIIVPLEFFPLTPPVDPFKHPGAMKTPYPDFRHYSTRDYGNRVGAYRLLRELAAAGLPASFAVNAHVAERYPPLIEAVRKGGHEVVAHGLSTAHIHHDGLSEVDERALIGRVRAAFPEATSWMSPARNESYRTLELLAEAGFMSCLDWEADQRPMAFATKNGPVWSLPHLGELGDFKLLIDRSQSEDAWADQIIEAARYQVSRYETEGASAFAFTMTPYVAGQPFRIHAVRRILSALAGMDGLEICTATDSIQAFQGATI